MKGKKHDKPPLTVGVRFAGLRHGKIYTYLVRPGHKLVRGDEVVADLPELGPMVGFVVRVDKVAQTDGPYDYKYLERRTVPV